MLVSCFYGSGQIIQNIPVTDASAIFRFFDDGELIIHPGDGKPYTRRIRTPGDVIPAELENFLYNPYFLEPDVYGIQMARWHAYTIRERKFILGPQDDWMETFSSSLLAEAVDHFNKMGLLEK